MGIFSKSGFWFLAIVLIVGIFVVGYAREDSFFGLSQGFDFVPKINDTSENFGNSDVEVFFCPKDNCADELIDEIDSSEESIYTAIYSFTHNDIADAFLRAKKRGVVVKVLFDEGQSNSKYSMDDFLSENGVVIERLKGDGLMHNKFSIIDGKKILTGSFNYSNNADTRNNENLIFINDASIASEYISEFNSLWDAS